MSEIVSASRDIRGMILRSSAEQTAISAGQGDGARPPNSDLENRRSCQGARSCISAWLSAALASSRSFLDKLIFLVFALVSVVLGWVRRIAHVSV